MTDPFNLKPGSNILFIPNNTLPNKTQNQRHSHQSFDRSRSHRHQHQHQHHRNNSPRNLKSKYNNGIKRQQSFLNEDEEEDEIGSIQLGFRIVKTPSTSVGTVSSVSPKSNNSNEPDEIKSTKSASSSTTLSKSPENNKWETTSNIMYSRWFNRPLPHPSSDSITRENTFRAKQEFRSGGPLFIGKTAENDSEDPFNTTIPTSSDNTLVPSDPSDSPLKSNPKPYSYIPPSVNIFKCFNCERPDHQLNQCPFRYNSSVVQRNRSLYENLAETQRNDDHFGDFPPPSEVAKSIVTSNRSKFDSKRYFSIDADPASDSSIQLSNIHQYRPGSCSSKLLHALGIQEANHAAWLRNIVIHGYPPSFIGPLPPFELLDIVESSWRKTHFGANSSGSVRSKRIRNVNSSETSGNSLRTAILDHWWFYVCYFNNLPAVYFEDSFDATSLPDFSTFTSIDELAKFCCSSLSSRIMLQYYTFSNNPDSFSHSFDSEKSVLTISIPDSYHEKSEEISLVTYDSTVLPLQIGHLVEYPTITQPPYLFDKPILHTDRQGLTIDQIRQLDSRLPSFEKYSKQIYGRSKSNTMSKVSSVFERSNDYDYDYNRQAHSSYNNNRRSLGSNRNNYNHSRSDYQYRNRYRRNSRYSPDSSPPHTSDYDHSRDELPYHRR